MTDDFKRLPAPALVLGALGLLPFIACALQIAAGWPLNPRMTGPALYALLLYGAIIVSFLGGVHWGLALTGSTSETATRRYTVAILPSLAAWAAAWIGGKTGLIGLTTTLVAVLAYDHWSANQGETPRPYVKLRNVLTAVAAASLLAAAFLGPFA